MEKSKQTLFPSLLFMAQSPLLTLDYLSRRSWHPLLPSSLIHSPQYSRRQMAGFPQRPPRSCKTTQTAFRLHPPTRNKVGLWILPCQGGTQRNPPAGPQSITSLFFQAVAICEAFPHAEHMGLISCRSLTTQSCSKSPNRLCLDPPLHLLLRPSGPSPHAFTSQPASF